MREVWEARPVLAKSYVNVSVFPRGEESSLPRVSPRVCTDTNRAVSPGAGLLTVLLFSLQQRWGAPECSLDCGVSARKWAKEQEG